MLGGWRKETICKYFVECRYMKKILENQKMASLPRELCIPCPTFGTMGLDLAGPYKVTSMLKRRDTRKG